jgi:phytoene dehydrogenase-like protein
MLKANKDSYDAIIIGAGISGLVCGCYLAKAGMKVLIAEQHFKPGGYCTSFKRKEFTFDAAAHSIGGLTMYGNLAKIFEELGIDQKIKIKKYDPSNIIITPDYQVSFWTDLDTTIKDFEIIFPHESHNIRNFFLFLIKPDLQASTSIKNWTFDKLLDSYFSDRKLKAVLSFPLILNGGLPPSLISAFIGAKIFKEFLLGGGYYPEGGMQALPDALAEKFKDFGGELRLSSPVKRIKIKDGDVKGVVIENGDFIASRYIVSNCDARQTFFKLLGKKILDLDFINRVNDMIPSLSAFVLYLGVDGYINNLPAIGTNLWILSNYDLDNVYLSAAKGNFNNIGGYLIYIYPDKKRVLAFVSAPFKNKQFWMDNKEKFSKCFINKIEKDIIPDLTKHLSYKDAATPHTLFKFTRNYKGAAFGWACTPSQLAITDFRKPSFVQGLYLTGHWTTKGLGIPGVVYVGYDTAKMIMRKEKRRFE